LFKVAYKTTVITIDSPNVLVKLFTIDISVPVGHSKSKKYSEIELADQHKIKAFKNLYLSIY
jgi:hypothetical protein